MSKRLQIQLTAKPPHPPIWFDVAIPEALAFTLERTPIINATFKVTDAIMSTPAAQKQELTGELDRYKIGE